MAVYKDAVQWIAENDSAGDTPAGTDYTEAFNGVRYLVSTVLVEDVFRVDGDKLACDILARRGFRKPAGWRPPT